MRFLKYKLGLIELPFEAPDNWSDVPFSTYIEYVKMIQDGKADNQAKIYSLFMPKVPAEYWDKPHHPTLYNSINGQLNFISDEPSKEVPTHIIKDGLEIITPKSVDEVTVNQYWGMLKAVDDVIKGKGDDVSTLEIMPEMIAIMLFKEYDNTSIEQLAKEINELPTDKVYGLGCFFLEKLNVLKSGTTLICRVKSRIRRILVQVMGEFLTITVILSRLITFRKGCLVSVKLYFKRKLLKFTSSYKYPLIFKIVNENTAN